jgi:hypothetical protein
MEQRAGGRRRIDRVTAPDLLDGLGEHPQEVLRALRDDCREEEARLSYARRVVQGQLDIARAELDRRHADGTDDDLVGRLSAVLADEPSGSSREARTVTFYSPDEGPDRRGGDAVAELPSLGQLPDLDDVRIAALITELEAEETRVSELRRIVLTHLDALQGELVRRYREGAADLDAILSAALPGRNARPGA